MQPWGLKAVWQGMGEGAGGADVGRGISPFLSFPLYNYTSPFPVPPHLLE